MSKKLIALLVFAQLICLTQIAQVKQAPDACPGSNKRNSTSSDYAYLSKRTSANSDFSKPKYQHLYANKTAMAPSNKRGKSSISQSRNDVTPKAEKQNNATPEANTNSSEMTKVKNKSSKSNREPAVNAKNEKVEAEEEEFVPVAEPVETKEAIEPSKTIKTEEPVEKAETVEPNKTVDAKGKTAATLKKEKQKEAAKKAEQKKQRKDYLKKLNVGKKNATDCPKF